MKTIPFFTAVVLVLGHAVAGAQTEQPRTRVDVKSETRAAVASGNVASGGAGVRGESSASDLPKGSKSSNTTRADVKAEAQGAKPATPVRGDTPAVDLPPKKASKNDRADVRQEGRVEQKAAARKASDSAPGRQ